MTPQDMVGAAFGVTAMPALLRGHRAECLSADDLYRRCAALERQLGPSARVEVSIGTGRPCGMEVCVGVHPMGIGREYRFSYGADFDTAFTAAREWVEARAVARNAGARL